MMGRATTPSKAGLGVPNVTALAMWLSAMIATALELSGTPDVLIVVDVDSGVNRPRDSHALRGGVFCVCYDGSTSPTTGLVALLARRSRPLPGRLFSALLLSYSFPGYSLLRRQCLDRHVLKNGIEDLRKAVWYLNDEIQRLEGNASNSAAGTVQAPALPKRQKSKQ